MTSPSLWIETSAAKTTPSAGLCVHLQLLVNTEPRVMDRIAPQCCVDDRSVLRHRWHWPKIAEHSFIREEDRRVLCDPSARAAYV